MTSQPRVHISFSTLAFAPEGVPAPGVPLFYNAASMELLELPTRWMFYIALERGRTKSPKTWRSYAESLLDWLRHCEANGWALTAIREGHLGAYRRHMLRSQTVNGDPFAASTINARLNTVARFYEWLHQRRLINAYPFGAEEVYLNRKDRGLLGFARPAPQKRRKNTLTVRKRIPRAIPMDTIVAIRRRLRERDCIIADWSLVTGMREDEILSLDLKELPDVSTVRNLAKVEMRITKTKGLYPRNVLVPVKLLDRAWRYINGERSRVLHKARRRGNLDTDAAFLSEGFGRRLSSKTLWAHFHEAAIECGAQIRFHDLRHTFAIHRLLTLERAKKENPSLAFVPLLRLRDDLGHRDLKSTQIYLESMEQDTTEVEQSLATLLDEVA